MLSHSLCAVAYIWMRRDKHVVRILTAAGSRPRGHVIFGREIPGSQANLIRRRAEDCIVCIRGGATITLQAVIMYSPECQLATPSDTVLNNRDSKTDARAALLFASPDHLRTVIPDPIVHHPCKASRH